MLRVPGQPFNRPTKAMAAASGQVFVSDGYGQHRVHRFSADGELELSWGEEGEGPGQFALPHELRRVRLVVERARDQHIEAGIARLAGGRNEVHALNGAKLGADGNGCAFLPFAFEISPSCTHHVPGPRRERREGDPVLPVCLLHACRLEVTTRSTPLAWSDKPPPASRGNVNILKADASARRTCSSNNLSSFDIKAPDLIIRAASMTSGNSLISLGARSMS